VINLRLGDVYLSENRLPHLRVNGKGQRERIVYLSAMASKLLEEYLGSRPPDSEKRVFLNWRGKPITITGIQLQLAKYCHQAGIWVTCHQLRHTFACCMIAAEVPVTSVQKMLGHVSLRTTQFYVEVADRQVERDYHAGIQKVIENSSTLLEVPNG
jgi:integrase/recombinase XerD